jgi:hypothetical protein
MKTNYPLTGTVDVVFRAYSQYTLNGRTYEAGEPVAYVKDTEASLVYGGVQKTATAVKRFTSFTDTFPESITIEANVFKDAILKMFATNLNPDYIEASKLVFITTDENGEFYLDSNITSVFVFDSNMDKVSSFTFNSESGLISGLTSNTEYYIDYGIKKTEFNGYGLKTVFLPYITVELKGSTIINGAAKNFLIRVPRAKLNMTPTFEFNPISFAQTSISFQIISEKEDPGVEIYFY